MEGISGSPHHRKRPQIVERVTRTGTVRLLAPTFRHIHTDFDTAQRSEVLSFRIFLCRDSDPYEPVMRQILADDLHNPNSDTRKLTGETH